MPSTTLTAAYTSSTFIQSSLPTITTTATLITGSPVSYSVTGGAGSLVTYFFDTSATPGNCNPGTWANDSVVAVTGSTVTLTNAPAVAATGIPVSFGLTSPTGAFSVASVGTANLTAGSANLTGVSGAPSMTGLPSGSTIAPSASASRRSRRRSPARAPSAPPSPTPPSAPT